MASRKGAEGSPRLCINNDDTRKQRTPRLARFASHCVSGADAVGGERAPSLIGWMGKEGAESWVSLASAAYADIVYQRVDGSSMVGTEGAIGGPLTREPE